MGEITKIQWCDHTFNPVIGCFAVSPGCAHCYAKDLVERFGKDFAQRRRTSPENWKQPLKWNKAAENGVCFECGTRKGNDCECGQLGALGHKRRARVFCASLADWLDSEWQIEWLVDLLKLIRDTPHLDWLLLTKRPENWNSAMLAASHTQSQLAAEWLRGYAPANVWIGTTVENQAMADERIPELLKIPAKVRFLSVEPLLGAIDLEPSLALWKPRAFVLSARDYIDWVIVGGESGPKSRPCNVEWIRSIVSQCQCANVPVFVKQLGAHCITNNANLQDWPDDVRIVGEGEGFAAGRVQFKHKKGGDPDEWPEDLRVRQFPNV